MMFIHPQLLPRPMAWEHVMGAEQSLAPGSTLRKQSRGGELPLGMGQKGSEMLIDASQTRRFVAV